MITHRPGTFTGTVIVAALLLMASLANAPSLLAQQFGRGAGQSMASSAARMVHPSVAARPILFTENIGQWPRGVRLQGTAGSTSVRFERHQVSYSYLVERRGKSGAATLDRHLLRTEFLGALADTRVEGDSATGALFNYYLGTDPSTWHDGARGFKRVRYRGLYEGIDALYYGHGGQMKYDFIVAPGADHRDIRLRYHGARKLRLTPGGEMEVVTGFGSVVEAAPYAYQEIGGKQVEVKASYRLLGGNVYGFSVGAHDPRYPVVIDPCLSVEYSTYFGGGGYDVVTSMAVDSTGNAYVVGFTRGSNSLPGIPEETPYTENMVFVSKISPDGSQLLYTTLIGQAYQGAYGVSGSTDDYQSIGEDVEVTRNGEAIVAMTTTIDTLATTANAYQQAITPDDINSPCGPPEFQNTEGYVARLNGSGKLVWSTYLGGANNDYIADIALDAADNVCITGMTYGATCGSKGDTLSFPVTVPRFGPADQLRGFETFVSVLSANGRTLQFSALYGGTRDEFAGRIGVDASNRIYLLGSTNSLNLPTTSGAYQETPNAGLGSEVFDLYIARINPGTAQLEYSSYFGDNGGAGRIGLGFNGFRRRFGAATVGGYDRQDRRQGLIVDRNGATIVFAGSTRSTGLPTTGGAFQGSARNGGGSDDASFNVFVVRLNMNTSQVAGATYVGGSAFDGLGGITYDRFGDVAVGVTTASSDFPTSAVTIQNELLGRVDGAIITLSPDLRSLTYGSYIGGSATAGSTLWEQAVAGVLADSSGGLYLYGGTSSRDLRVTPQALQKQNDYYGGFIVKFAAPSAPRIGAGLGITFEANVCGDILMEPMLVFNSGQSPMRIDSLKFKNGQHYSLVNPPAVPFMLAPCDTFTLMVAFDATKLECSTRGNDSLIIVAGNAENPRVTIPVSGIRRCLTFSFLQTELDVERYKLGSGKYVGFTANVRGQEDQYLTITPDVGNNNIFEPIPQRVNSVLQEGTSGIAFRVNAQDTGTYCETFTATVQPCNRVFKLRICARVTSGIFTSIDTVNYGLMSCRELDLPHVVRNTGNDTLDVSVAYVDGPNATNVEFVENVGAIRRLPPGDTTVYILPIRPKGYGQQSSTIYFKTNEGGESGRLRGVTVNVELDSVAFRLANASSVGSFGQTIEMPISYESLLEGRMPLEELTLLLKFDPKMLAVTGINTDGMLAAGWEIVSSRYVPDGTIIKVRKGASGASFPGRTGRLFNVQFKVLRGDTLVSQLGLALAGASAGCLTAEIDSAMLFRLNEECATPERLIVTGRRTLKQSIPNPARSAVTIPYFLSEPNHVTLVLYDATGREVATLVDDDRPAGESEVRFDTHQFPTGKYFYRLTVGEATSGNVISETRTMVIER